LKEAIQTNQQKVEELKAKNHELQEANNNLKQKETENDQIIMAKNKVGE
jgi:FtsZ-binding cell division protein ZapB